MSYPVEPLEIELPRGRLAARLHRPGEPPRAAAVIAHGQASSMASQKLTRLARALARSGVAALQFDHSGCGDSLGELELTTLSGRRAEFLAAVETLVHLTPGLPLIYLGSSLGGTVALLAADKRPPRCTVVWSAPLDMAELLPRLDPPPEGFSALVNDMPNHDLPAVLGRARGVLFVHGQRDEVVPVRHARFGHRLVGPPKDLLILPGADHRLSRLVDQELAVERTIAFIQNRLQGGLSPGGRAGARARPAPGSGAGSTGRSCPR